MLATALDTEEILSRLARAVRRPELSAKPGQLVSVTLAAVHPFENWLTAATSDGVYWACAAAQRYRLAFGRALLIEGSGPTRFEQLNRRFSTVSKDWVRLDPDRIGDRAAAFLGFAFDANDSDPKGAGLGNSRVLVPSLIFERDGSLTSLTVTAPWPVSKGSMGDQRQRWLAEAEKALRACVDGMVGAIGGSSADVRRLADFPPGAEWKGRVIRALRAIRAGHVEKVVLTRRAEVQGRTRLAPHRLLRWLEQHYPGCVQFACFGESGVLVGASPETLLRVRGGNVVSDAVAGTVARGNNRGDDHGPGEALLESSKLRLEHQLVVRAISMALAPYCRTLSVPEKPQLLTLPTLQHLRTPIHGRLSGRTGLLQLAGALHPTPAVGGFPRKAAMEWLEREGETARGWYTGALGWITPGGEGELSVVLRCALLKGKLATLYAGAGIVAGSDPDAELAETEWKLQTMLDALRVA